MHLSTPKFLVAWICVVLSLENAACMADGLSVRKTAARLNISVQKAFRWRHKFLGLLNKQKPEALTGIVEADETLFPVSYKGQRKGLPRASKKRGGKLKTGEGAEKVTVVVVVQRGTQVEFDQMLSRGSVVAQTWQCSWLLRGHPFRSNFR